jgi:opacity protein-like surface antigen
MRHSITTALAAFVVAAVCASSAAAATPQQIYQDLADNGRLDHRYSAPDLARALNSPTYQGYTSPVKKQNAAGVKAATTSKSNAKPAATQTSSGALPFTGLDLSLMVAGALALIVLGFGIRRLARPELDI